MNKWKNAFAHLKLGSSTLKPRQTALQRRKAFAKLFAENMHLFNMSCDYCSFKFSSLDEARSHYATVHDNTKGYIRCCNSKLRYRSGIISHLELHSNPQVHKYAIFIYPLLEFIEIHELTFP